MASRNWNDEGVLGVKRCRVDFKFNPQGALAPTFSRDQARGVASITRTGVEIGRASCRERVCRLV